MQIYAWIYLGLMVFALLFSGVPAKKILPVQTQVAASIIRTVMIMPFIGRILGWW